MDKHLFVSSLAAALLGLTADASAQTVEVNRRNAFALNVGPMIGILGGGEYVRINPEFQLHQGRRFDGHMFGIGLAVVPWPNERGPSFAVSARWQYDHQLVSGTPFFVSPYAGADVGLGIFDLVDSDGPLRFRFVAAPMVGLDVKLVINERWLLGFRPIGITVPLFIGGPSVTVDVLYDISFTVGLTF
jgi:hypothetical protein